MNRSRPFMHARSPRAAAPGAGFTLIELMVVVVVILTLLGIAAGVGSQLMGGQEVDLTRTSLKTAVQIYEEYTNTIGGTTTINAGQTGADNLAAAAWSVRSLKDLYIKLDERLIWKDTNNNKTADAAERSFYDAWQNKLYFVPKATPSDNSPINGNPRKPYPYFFSAGPDGSPGTLTDNVYSDDQK